MRMLRQLLTIKQFREGQAALRVSRERQRMSAAARAHRDAQEELARLRERSREEERSMYGDLCSRLVRVREIDNVLQRVAVMRDGEQQCDRKRESAGERETEAALELAQARRAHQAVIRQRDKFVDLVGVYAADALKELENKEDAESEEAASAAWRPREWDDAMEDPT